MTALRRTIRQLGSKVPTEPEFDFKGTNKGEQFIQTAFVLENTGVRALSPAPSRRCPGELRAQARSSIGASSKCVIRASSATRSEISGAVSRLTRSVPKSSTLNDATAVP